MQALGVGVDLFERAEVQNVDLAVGQSLQHGMHAELRHSAAEIIHISSDGP